MSFLFFFILRKIFVRLEISDKEINLEKGLIFKRSAVMPVSAAVRITVKKTLVLRIFKAMEISVYSLCGKIKFYLPQNERPPFLAEYRAEEIKPRFRDIAFGAFIDTRALGGLFVFAAVLRRISAIFGSEYFDRVIDIIQKTAAGLESSLKFLQIAVPKAAVVLAVFALSAWCFAFVRKLLRLMRFRVAKSNGTVFVCSGIVTLYEHMLVSNSAAAVYCDTLTTLLLRRAPLYLRKVMICPCSKREEMRYTAKRLCEAEVPTEKITSPKRAFFGHIAAPLTWAGVFAAALVAVYRLSDYSTVLKTILYSGIIVSLYSVGIFLLYFPRSGIAFGEDYSAVAARRGMRLYTAVFQSKDIKRKKTSQNVFQKRMGNCNLQIATIERTKYTVRQIPKNELQRHIPF